MPSHMVDSQKSRADNFPLEEIQLMLKEMKYRSEIILSLSPSSHRLKKSAWEEVANVMGMYFQKRTPEQVKKKWENLLTKTRRKVRQGLMNGNSWSHLNNMVWSFLLENREAKYLFGPGRFSRQNDMSNLIDSTVMCGSKVELNVSQDPWSNCTQVEQPFVNINSKPHEPETNILKSESIDSLDAHDIKEKINSESIGFSEPINDTLFTPCPTPLKKSSQDEILSMWKSEHEVRMKILTLQHEAAAIQLKLTKIKLEKETGIRFDNK